MAWISASNDPGFYVGPNTNMTGSICTSTTASLFYWKSLMKTAGWQICASWNGSSGAFYQDILTGVLTLGSNNAWFLISQPGSSRSILISNQSSDQWRWKYSYTGFTLTGSLANQVPTAKIITSQSTATIFADANGAKINGEAVMVGGGSDQSPATTTAPLGLFNVNSVVQMAAQNTAPYQFWFAHYNVLSTDHCSGAFFLDAMESGTYSTGFVDQYLIYARPIVGGNRPFNVDSLNNNGGGGSLSNGWGIANNLSASWTGNTYNNICYSYQAAIPNNTSATDGLGITIPGNTNGTGYIVSGVNFCVYDGQVELHPAMAVNSNPNSATRFSAANGNIDTGYRGMSGLFRWKTPGAVRVGSTISTVSGAKNWISLGDTAFPWFGFNVTGAQVGVDYLGKEAQTTTQYMTGSTDWFSGKTLWALDDSNFMTTIIQGGSSTGSLLFRGTLGGQYVYNVGSPPVGAANIVVIKIN